MKTAKLGAIFLMSVMALAGIGASYACWYDDLDIEGVVWTGVLDAEWSIECVGDTEPDEKDVSWVDAWIEDDLLVVVVNNAYPCITYWVHFDIHNNGTIPFILGAFDIEHDIPGYFNITDFEGVQLHPCEAVYGYIEIHLDNTAEQGATYYFTARIRASQWNEYPCEEESGDCRECPPSE
jgi:hypothetical protein